MNEYRRKLLAAINYTKSENEITSKEWASISKLPFLTIEFIREFQEQVAWYYITEPQTLTEDFIREFQNRVNWDWISKNQNLSESFIREFNHKVEWHNISRYQILSDGFLIEFNEEIYWNGYMTSRCASFPIMKKFIFKTNYTYIDEIKHSHLSAKQKNDIEKMLALRYMFTN